MAILKRKIYDPKILWLVHEIIRSFKSGIPIGNLTSQLFANIYLNELDQFVKHNLKIPFYIRYTDDFVVIQNTFEQLADRLRQISIFLKEELKLNLHPQKITIRKYHQGMDFLGFIQFPHYRALRTKTRRRIMKKIKSGVSEQSLQSYLGVLSHANSYKLAQELKNLFWLNKPKQ